MVGSQKRVIRNDSDEETYAPALIRRPTNNNNPISLLEMNTDENQRDDIERKIKDVVRLAVFTSHSDSSLKRDDIKNSKAHSLTEMDNHGERLMRHEQLTFCPSLSCGGRHTKDI